MFDQINRRKRRYWRH